MNEILNIIENKYNDNPQLNMKIVKDWFIDFCELLLNNGFPTNEVINILENELLNEQNLSVMKNKSRNYSLGMNSIQHKNAPRTNNEKSFFNFVNEILQDKESDYLKSAINYVHQRITPTTDFITLFIKYIIITNFSSLKTKSDLSNFTKINDYSKMTCSLGDFVLSSIELCLDENGVIFDNFHTLDGLTNTKIGAVLFRNLQKEMSIYHPDKHLYAINVLKVNYNALRFYKKMGAQVFAATDAHNLGIIYDKDELLSLSSLPINPPTLEESRAEEPEFITLFEEKYQSKKMCTTTSTNKDNKRLIIFKQFETKKITDIVYNNKAKYYIFTEDQEYVGKITINVSNKKEADEVEMEYYAVSDSSKNKGNIQIGVREVLKDIYTNMTFDNLPVRQGEKKSYITNVFLSIHNNNAASLAVAHKCGFTKDIEHQTSGIYKMTREQFYELQNNIEEQNKKTT